VSKRLHIEAIAPGGEGVAHAAAPGGGTRPVFVAFTAPGDEVDADVPSGDGAAHAELLRVVSPGAERVEPPCRHFGPDRDRCGGCEWLHLSYEAQLAAKARGLAEALRRIARLAPGDYEARPIVPSPEPLRYRSRAKFHVDRGSGRLVFFRRRTHEPVRLAECWLLRPGLDRLREEVGPALAAVRLDAREATLEWSDREERGAAGLRISAVTPSVRSRAEALLAAVPALRGVVLAPDGAPPVIVGDPVLAHDRRPGDPAAGEQRSRPDVFQQANRGANARLVELAVGLLAPDGAEALELYCGSGNFTAALSARARAVHAVEAQGPALDLARSALGGVGIRFYAGDSLRIAQALAREGRRPGVVLLDPPREGAKGIAPVLRELAPSRCVYVSCDPATLARDVRACVEAGYRAAVVQAVDMFPQTHHVEGVVLLEKVSR
jgi:23S rRNA (uracil1939-C5)-methyltransferase